VTDIPGSEEEPADSRYGREDLGPVVRFRSNAERVSFMVAGAGCAVILGWVALRSDLLFGLFLIMCPVVFLEGLRAEVSVDLERRTISSQRAFGAGRGRSTTSRASGCRHGARSRSCSDQGSPDLAAGSGRPRFSPACTRTGAGELGARARWRKSWDSTSPRFGRKFDRSRGRAGPGAVRAAGDQRAHPAYCPFASRAYARTCRDSCGTRR
jgi:hypothetical protein